MLKTTTDQTIEYIKEHPSIKNCLQKGLINYSALSRLIARERGIEKFTSKEAILIAARRFHEKLKKDVTGEKEVKELLAKSEIELKNKVVVFVTEKAIDLENVGLIQKKVRKEYGTFYLVEGSDHLTLVTQEKYETVVDDKFKNKIIKKSHGLTLIMMRSSQEIEHTIGVLAYLTSLFAENGVNILELLSCWTDSIFIVKSEDVSKVLQFLKF